MRVLVGTYEICRQLYDIADGLRKAGHHADACVYGRCVYHPELRYRYDFSNGPPTPFPSWLNRIMNPLVRFPRGAVNRFFHTAMATYLLARYDAFIFLFGHSLGYHEGSAWDHRLAKRLGKRIVSIFVGSDVRYWPAGDTHFRLHGLELAPAYKPGEGDLQLQMTKLRVAELYADAIFGQPSYMQLAVRSYRHLFIPIDLSRYRLHVPARDVPVVVHAPSVRSGKGTEQILAVLNSLRAEGVRFELRLLEGKPNAEVIAELEGSDVVIDQLEAGTNAMLATEGLATGCAVAGGNHERMIPFPANRPVLHIDSRNVYRQVKRLLVDKDLRVQLAHAGGPFVKRYHDHVQVAKGILAQVGPAGEGRCDYYPTYFAREFTLGGDEAVSDRLKRMTGAVMTRWGLPEDVKVSDLVERGLLPAGFGDRDQAIPRWAVPCLQAPVALAAECSA